MKVRKTLLYLKKIFRFDNSEYKEHIAKFPEHGNSKLKPRSEQVCRLCNIDFKIKGNFISCSFRKGFLEYLFFFASNIRKIKICMTSGTEFNEFELPTAGSNSNNRFKSCFNL